jgi:hypothetical protein
MKPTHSLTSQKRKDLDRADAHGELVAVVIGVSNYSTAGFGPLKTCTPDAVQVAKHLSEVHQLRADPKRVSLITSANNKPSKGVIIEAIKAAVAATSDTDRLLFYFSGHGYRIPGDERLFLVPEDVWDVTPDAMLDFRFVCELLESSPAREKYIVLDACYSGPSTQGIKGTLTEQSVKFVTDYISHTKGFAIIGSSSEDEPSHTRSPDPDVSLFTHYFCKALRGEPAALHGTQLTTTSLVEYLSVEVPKRAKSYQSRQSPTFKIGGNGVQVWGDFARILAPAVLQLGSSPVRRVKFLGASPMNATDVLTKLRKFTLHQEDYIERRVNENLGEHLEETLGKKAAALIETLAVSASDVAVGDASISFPKGSYGAEYKSDDVRRGRLVETVAFEKEWLSKPEEMLSILETLDLHPTLVRFFLSFDIDPASAIPGLKVQGWTLSSSLDGKVEMQDGSQRIVLTPDSIAFRGFILSEMFGTDADKRCARLAAGVFHALPASGG